MSLTFNWGSLGNIGNSRVRLGRISGLVQAADRGTVASCQLELDDPSANLILPGLEAVYVNEGAATNSRVWQGYAAEREIARSGGDESLILGGARRWDGSLVDMNAAFGFLVARGADAKRPAETVDARIAWCISEFGASFPDEGHVVSSSLTLSAADYTGMYPSDILGDCAELTGFNFFRYYAESAGHGALGFFPNSYTGYDSTLRLTNVAADVDNSTTFGSSATLNRDPSDRYTGVLVVYNGGQKFVGDSPRTSSSRETSITKDTISTSAHAAAYANQFLADHAADVDEITAVAQVPKAHVNDAMPGQRIQVKFSHLDGYEDWTYIRIAQRSVAQDKETQDRYTITFTLRNPRSTGGAGGGPGGGGGSVGNPGVPGTTPPPFIPCPVVDPHFFSFSFDTDPATDHSGVSTSSFLVSSPTIVTYNYSFTVSDIGVGLSAGLSSLPTAQFSWNIGANPLTFDILPGDPTTHTGSFTSGDGTIQYAHVGAAVTTHVEGWVDPVGWVPPDPEDCTPLPGQVVVSTDGAPELITMATGDTTGQTNYPYATGGLHIFVSGYGEVIVSQTDPTTGTFELPFPKPAGAQVYGWYIAGSGPATGATNGPAISELDYIPPELLGSGSDRSGDNVLHDDWTWAPATDTSNFETKIEGGQDTIKAHGSMGSTETFDPTDGNVHTGTLNANCTFTLSAPSGSGAATIELYLTQDGTGSRTVTWPGSVVWPGGVTPTLSTAAGSVDRFVLETLDGGTVWYGVRVGGGSSGTVTSVALTVPAELSVAGSPVTTSGTLAVTKATQSANQVWAGPTSGSAAQPAFRALVAADIPSGVGQTDHQHIDNVTFSGDGSTTVFELPAAPFDAYSVQAFVAGVKVGQSLSGTMLTTLTFDTAPASGTDNISVDIVAVAA